MEPVQPPVGEASSEQQEGASQMPDLAVIIVSNVEIYKGKLYRVNTKKVTPKIFFLTPCMLYEFIFLQLS